MTYGAGKNSLLQLTGDMREWLGNHIRLSSYFVEMMLDHLLVMLSGYKIIDIC